MTSGTAKATLPFGDAVRILLQRRRMKGVHLAKKTGVSPTSISKIINGVTRPRKVTFSRMIKALCTNREEQQIMIAAFTGTEGLLEEEQTVPTLENEQIEQERIERYMEVRTQAISFKNALGRELDRAGIGYIRDFCRGICSADFLIERDGERIALESKFNVNRDFPKAVGLARMVLENLNCRHVFVVTPYIDESVEESLPDLDEGISVVTV